MLRRRGSKRFQNFALILWWTNFGLLNIGRGQVKILIRTGLLEIIYPVQAKGSKPIPYPVACPCIGPSQGATSSNFLTLIVALYCCQSVHLDTPCRKGSKFVFSSLLCYIGGMNTPSRRGTAKKREYVCIEHISLLL